MSGWGAERIGWGLGLALAVNIAVMAVIYVVYPGYVDHGEGAISAAAWRMLSGIPVYHPFDAAERTTNLYGPVNYLWHAWPMALFGATIASGKLAAALSAILIPLVVGWHLRRWSLGGWMLALVSAMLALHLAFPVVIRPDSLLTALVGLAVILVARAENHPHWGISVALGVIAALCVNLKINSVIYLAPVGLYYLLGDWRRALIALPVTVLASVAPFALHVFPAADYLVWFAPMAAKEWTRQGFLVLGWKLTIPLIVPPILAGLAGRDALSRLGWRVWAYGSVYILAILVTIFPAAKDGGGAQYFMPFLPMTADLALRLGQAGGNGKRLRLGLILAGLAVLVMMPQQERRFLKKLDWDEARAATSEIKAILADHPGKRIQMGVGGVTTGDNLTYSLYAWRNLPIYAGHPYSIDSGIMMELTKLNIPVPQATLDLLAACDTQLWMVPKGEVPFSLWGYYRQPAFPPQFRATFAAHHVLKESRQLYDVWECRP